MIAYYVDSGFYLHVRARFRDFDGVATNTMGLPDSIATNVLPIVRKRNSGLTTISTYMQ